MTFQGYKCSLSCIGERRKKKLSYSHHQLALKNTLVIHNPLEINPFCRSPSPPYIGVARSPIRAHVEAYSKEYASSQNSKPTGSLLPSVIHVEDT